MTFSDVTPSFVRGLAVASLVLVAGCGQGGGSSSSTPSATATSSPSSPSSSASPSSGASGSAAADGRCGGGKFKTKVVRAARGVTLTVPATWEVEAQKAGSVYRLYPPNRSVSDGYLLVQPTSQSLDEVVAATQAATRDAAKVVSEQALSRTGLKARLTSFRYPESLKSMFSVDVAAVGGGVRVVANLAGPESASEQAVAESCLSSVQRR